MACSTPLHEQRGVQLSTGDGPGHLHGHAATNGSDKSNDRIFAADEGSVQREGNTNRIMLTAIFKRKMLTAIKKTGSSPARLAFLSRMTDTGWVAWRNSIMVASGKWPKDNTRLNAAIERYAETMKINGDLPTSVIAPDSPTTNALPVSYDASPTTEPQ